VADIYAAIVSLRPDSTFRADSLVDETGGIDTSMLETPMSSAISSSFQGTETESVEDEILAATGVESKYAEKRLQNIEMAIDRLYRLSLMIRQPSRSVQNEKAELFIMRDDEGNSINDTFAVYARHIVDHQFPDAPEYLRTRLSNGIVTRRKRFLYRQSHQRKLSNAGVHADREQDETTETLTAGGADSTVRALRMKEELPSRNFQDLDLVLRIPAPSHTSASAIPQQPLPLSTVLEDAKSSQSTAFTASPSVSTPVEIPRAPKPAAGSKEFECPYCCLMLPIKESKAFRWRYVLS
jgi:hypothetical protein